MSDTDQTNSENAVADSRSTFEAILERIQHNPPKAQPEIPETIGLPTILHRALVRHDVDIARFAVAMQDGLFSTPVYPAMIKARSKLSCLPPEFPAVLLKAKAGRVTIDRMFVGDALLKTGVESASLEFKRDLDHHVLDQGPIPARSLVDDELLEGYAIVAIQGTTARLDGPMQIEVRPPRSMREFSHGRDVVSSRPFADLDGSLHAHVHTAFMPAMMPVVAEHSGTIETRVRVMEEATPGIETTTTTIRITGPYDPSPESDFVRFLKIPGIDWDSAGRSWRILSGRVDLQEVASIIASNHDLVVFEHGGREVVMEKAEAARRRIDLQEGRSDDTEAVRAIRRTLGAIAGHVPDDVVDDVHEKLREGIVGALTAADAMELVSWHILVLDVLIGARIPHDRWIVIQELRKVSDVGLKTLRAGTSTPT